MAVQAVAVDLPGPLCERLARRATRSLRSIEAALADAVATLPDEPDELPADMAEAMEPWKHSTVPDAALVTSRLARLECRTKPVLQESSCLTT